MRLGVKDELVRASLTCYLENAVLSRIRYQLASSFSDASLDDLLAHVSNTRT